MTTPKPTPEDEKTVRDCVDVWCYENAVGLDVDLRLSLAALLARVREEGRQQASEFRRLAMEFGWDSTGDPVLWLRRKIESSRQQGREERDAEWEKAVRDVQAKRERHDGINAFAACDEILQRRLKDA